MQGRRDEAELWDLEDMYAFWMNGHDEHGAGSSAVVGIDTGPTPDETIFADDATIAGPARCDDTDVTNPTKIEVTLKMSRIDPPRHSGRWIPSRSMLAVGPMT